MIVDYHNLLTEWLKSCERNFTKRTSKHYNSCLQNFLQFTYQDGGLIDSKVIEGYIDFKILAGWSNRTINSNLTAIRSFCRWRTQHEDIPNPAGVVPMLVEEPPKQRVLSQSEYEKVLGVSNSRQKDIVVFLGHTGLRSNEFSSLKWDCVSIDQKYLTVLGKGRKQRTVPLNQSCRDILKKSKLSFISKNNLGRVCQALAKKAGIPSFGPHALRHMFATNLIKNNISIYKVSKILGHSSVKTTEKIYIHLIPIDLIGITDVLD